MLKFQFRQERVVCCGTSPRRLGSAEMSDNAIPGTELDVRHGNIITVSNRLPMTIVHDHGRVSLKQSVGGLASGLRAVIRGDGHTWIGWPGDTTDLTPAQARAADEQFAALGA